MARIFPFSSLSSISQKPHLSLASTRLSSHAYFPLIRIYGLASTHTRFSLDFCTSPIVSCHSFASLCFFPTQSHSICSIAQFSLFSFSLPNNLPSHLIPPRIHITHTTHIFHHSPFPSARVCAVHGFPKPNLWLSCPFRSVVSPT